jgi:F420-0:gamma-glutamyl ligase
VTGVAILPVRDLPELREGDDLAALVLDRIELEDDDVVVVAQKAISKIEGRIVRLDGIEPSPRAVEIAGEGGDAARRIEVILREAKSIVRVRPPLVICETQHGFICASAGVDSRSTRMHPQHAYATSCTRAAVATSASSSPIRSAVHGVRARPTSPSALQAWRCSRTCRGGATRSATSCTRP